MARTRRNAMLIEETRSKVRTSQLINRLQDHVLGKVTLSVTQVRSAEILLRKSLPDLASVELTGKDGGAIETKDVSLNDAARRVALLFAAGLKTAEGP